MNTFSHDDYLQSHDMGFTFHDENDFIDPLTHDQAIRDGQTSQAIAQGRLDRLYNTIVPFLKNLQANPDKPYINWPDRAKKVQEFRNKIERIYQGRE